MRADPGRPVKVWNLPAREKSWLPLLLLVSAAARTALLLVPFRFLTPHLGTLHGNIPLSPLATESQIALARRIGALSAAVARRTPWQSKCLVQAIMVKTLLNHYGIPYVLYLGVAKTQPTAGGEAGASRAALTAHAWVSIGSRVVSGAAGCNAFTVVSVFVSPLLQRPPQSGSIELPEPHRPRRALAMTALDP